MYRNTLCTNGFFLLVKPGMVTGCAFQIMCFSLCVFLAVMLCRVILQLGLHSLTKYPFMAELNRIDPDPNAYKVKKIIFSERHFIYLVTWNF